MSKRTEDIKQRLAESSSQAKALRPPKSEETYRKQRREWVDRDYHPTPDQLRDSVREHA